MRNKGLHILIKPNPLHSASCSPRATSTCDLPRSWPLFFITLCDKNTPLFVWMPSPGGGSGAVGHRRVQGLAPELQGGQWGLYQRRQICPTAFVTWKNLQFSLLTNNTWSNRKCARPGRGCESPLTGTLHQWQGMKRRKTTVAPLQESCEPERHQNPHHSQRLRAMCQRQQHWSDEFQFILMQGLNRFHCPALQEHSRAWHSIICATRAGLSLQGIRNDGQQGRGKEVYGMEGQKAKQHGQNGNFLPLPCSQKIWGIPGA